MTNDLDVDEMEACEGCEALLDPEHVRRDVEGVPLCDECWDDMIERNKAIENDRLRADLDALIKGLEPVGYRLVGGRSIYTNPTARPHEVAMTEDVFAVSDAALVVLQHHGSGLGALASSPEGDSTQAADGSE